MARVLLATFAVILVAGCGGDEGLSKNEFIDAADAICADADRRINALGGTPVDEQEAGEWWSALTAIGRDALVKLRALSPSDEERDEVNEVLTAFERAFAAETIGEGVGLVIAAVGRARQYGLEDCTRLGIRAG